MDNIIRTIQATSKMSNDSIIELTSHFTKLIVPKKHILIKAGSVDRNFYLIEKGISRCFCLIDGKEITIWFSKEGYTSFSMLSCYQNKPCHDYIQMLEKGTVYTIPMDVLDQLYASNIEIANWGRIIHQNALLEVELRLIDRYSKSARERYVNLLESEPNLFQRVNLGYIASYLGISQVTLCNLRNECK